MRSQRLHTIRDIDGGSPPVSALGGRREPSEMRQPEFNFGGANLGLPQPEAVHKLPTRIHPSMRHTIYRHDNNQAMPSMAVKTSRFIIPR